MFEAKLRAQLAKIFEDFANGNGKISPDEINLDIVSTDMLLVFKPMLVEMENFDEDLDKEEFIESSLALLETLDIISRNMVLNYGRKVPRSKADLHQGLSF